MSSYSVRELQIWDLNEENTGRLSLMLSGLRATELQDKLAQTLLTWMQNQWTKVFAAFNDSQEICGSLSLLLEIKMLQWWCVAWHIEDVATHPDHLRQWIWTMLIKHAESYARDLEIVLLWEETSSMSTYKIILDCSPDLTNYYAKQWFETAWLFMRTYLTSD